MIDNSKNTVIKVKGKWSELRKKHNEESSDSTKNNLNLKLGALIIAVIQAGILVFTLIYIIFLIKPSQAHVSVDISELTDDEISLLADEARFRSLDKNEIIIASGEAVRIKLEAYEVEGWPLPTPDYYWLIISPDVPNEVGACRFILTGKIKETKLYNVSSNNLRYFNTEKTKCYFDGPQHLQIIRGNAIIESSNGEVIAKLNNDSLNIIERKTNKPDNLSTPYDILSNAEKIEYLGKRLNIGW